MGQGDSGLAAVRRAVVLDPLNPFSHAALGQALLLLRRYEEAIAAYSDAHALNPGDWDSHMTAGFLYYLVANLQAARSSCEIKPENDYAHFCLALIYDKLRRQADAQAMLAKLRATRGDNAAYEYTVIYA